MEASTSSIRLQWPICGMKFIRERGLGPDDIGALYNKVHAAIQAYPTPKKSDKPVSNEHKRHNPKRLTCEERRAKLIKKLKALNSAVDHDDSVDE
ncbi:60S ribosomal protein L5 (Fragment) [Linum perenne]